VAPIPADQRYTGSPVSVSAEPSFEDICYLDLGTASTGPISRLVDLNSPIIIVPYFPHCARVNLCVHAASVAAYPSSHGVGLLAIVPSPSQNVTLERTDGTVDLVGTHILEWRRVLVTGFLALSLEVWTAHAVLHVPLPGVCLLIAVTIRMFPLFADCSSRWRSPLWPS
jgi:hypothetical protein